MFLQLYMNPSGNNLNSGTTAADAGGSDSSSYSSLLGDFDGTNTFTPNDGSTPANSISVGDWISLYNNGDTACRCLAKVQTVNAGVNGTVVIDTAHKFGTVPTNSGTAHTRNLVKGGAFKDFAIMATSACLNTGTVTDATKINIKTGTYANTTTARSFALTGTTTLPVWWSGYKTTPGDLDSSPTVTRTPATDMPTYTATTGQVTLSGSHTKFSSIDFTGAVTASNGLVSVSGTNFECFRCRFTNTAANAASAAMSTSGGTNQIFIDCYFSATSTATNVVSAARAGNVFQGCTFTGGGVGILVGASTFAVISYCEFKSLGSHCIQTTNVSVSLFIDHCSAYGTGVGDFYNMTTNLPAWAIVTNNEVYGVINGINNTTGANTNVIIRNNNAYGTLTGSAEVGLGDSPAFDGQTELGFPFISSSNLTLQAAAAGFQEGCPGLFENSLTQSFASIGAATPKTFFLIRGRLGNGITGQ